MAEAAGYSTRVLREQLKRELNEKRANPPASYGADGLHRLKLKADGKLSEAQIEAYKSDGYLILRDVLPARELEGLRDECWGCWSGIKGKGGSLSSVSSRGAMDSLRGARLRSGGHLASKRIAPKYPP